MERPKERHPAALNAERTGPLLSRGIWERCGTTLPRSWVVRVDTTTHNPSPEPITEASKQPELTTTRKTAKPKKLEPKLTTYPKRATLKTKNQAATSVKPVADNPNRPKLVVRTHSTTFPLEGISDLLGNLPLPSCLELNRWLLTPISSISTGVARPRVVLKTVILFWLNMATSPRKTMRVKHCASPAGMRTGCEAGISNCITFCTNAVSIYAP